MPGQLTTAQAEALRERIDEVPGRVALLPRYPPPRPRGKVTLPSGRVIEAGAGAAGPRMPAPMNWVANVFAAGGAQRSTAVSEPFAGPALITAVVLTYQLATTTTGGFALLVSEDGAGAQINGADTTPPPGLSVLAPTTNADTSTTLYIDEVRGSFPGAFRSPGRKDQHFALRYVIPWERFFLKWSVRNNGATPAQGQIWVAMLTNLDLNQIPNFL